MIFTTTHPSKCLCKSCEENKLHKTPFSSGGRKQAEVPLGLVHNDVCGPLGAESLSGARYFLTFVDEKNSLYMGVFSEVQK